MNGHNPTIDLDTLAEHGPKNRVACAECGKGTRSHVVESSGGEWDELDRRNPLAARPPGEVVRLAILCHGCYTDMGREWEPKPTAQSVFKIRV